jgi:hypothetical protein
MQMKRIQKAMSTRWGIIQHAMNLLRGYHANIEAITESGMNSANMVSARTSILCVFLIGYALMSLCFLALVVPCTIVVPEEKQIQRIRLVALLYQDQRMLEANTP